MSRVLASNDRSGSECDLLQLATFLGAAGDPYAKVGLDSTGRAGRAGIDWGVYGVPETFIARGDGVIAYKVIGPMNADTLDSVVEPKIAKAMKERIDFHRTKTASLLFGG
ncbi:MAG: hypothetical protein WAV18_05560 [Roseiarcus sp.]